jgi:hypothetical protein
MNSPNLDIDNAVPGIVRKPGGRPLRGAGLYSGNLIAYSQVQSKPERPFPFAAPPAQNTSDKPRSVGTHKKTVLTMLLALATGAVVGSAWTTGAMDEKSQPADQLSTVADISSTSKLAPDAQNTAPPFESDIDSIIEELESTHQQAEEYLGKIEWLDTQNASLRKEIESLTSENLALNRELLDLDLAFTTLESKSLPKVETRTVYNFVNVPIGSDPEAPNNALDDPQQDVANAAVEATLPHPVFTAPDTIDDALPGSQLDIQCFEEKYAEGDAFTADPVNSYYDPITGYSTDSNHSDIEPLGDGNSN